MTVYVCVLVRVCVRVRVRVRVRVSVSVSVNVSVTWRTVTSALHYISTASGLLIFSPGEETYAKECNDNTPMMASDEETTTPEDTEFKHHVHHIHSGMDSDDILGEGKQSGINDPSLQNDYLLNLLEKDR